MDDGAGALTTAGQLCGSCGTPLSATAKFCSECGTPVVPATPPAEYKQVTVLFAEVVIRLGVTFGEHGRRGHGTQAPPPPQALRRPDRGRLHRAGGRGLAFVGRVGTGFNTADLEHLGALLAPLATDVSPFNAAIPANEHRRAHYVQPVHVGEVRYGLQTADGRLRFPSWRGLRTDKTVDTMR